MLRGTGPLSQKTGTEYLLCARPCDGSSGFTAVAETVCGPVSMGWVSSPRGVMDLTPGIYKLG